MNVVSLEAVPCDAVGYFGTAGDVTVYYSKATIYLDVSGDRRKLGGSAEGPTCNGDSSLVGWKSFV